LRSQSLPQRDFTNPADVLTGLNLAFPMSSNNKMYFTMWYGVYNRNSRELVYGSGGHPPGLLVTGKTAQDAKLIQLSTPCLVVGAIPQAVFKNGSCQVDSFGELFVYSDGVYEITKPDGNLMDRDEFIAALIERDRKTPAVDYIYDYMRNLQNSDNFVDDFSILRVEFR